VLFLTSAVGSACGLAGCGLFSSSGTRGEGRALTTSDFVKSEGSGATTTRPGASAQPLAAPNAIPIPPNSARAPDRFHPIPSPHTPRGDETLDVSALIGAPKLPPTPPTVEPTNTTASPSTSSTPAQLPLNAPAPFVLESLVGQINGRPVFASEILEPLDGRLRAMAAKTKDRAKWTADAKNAVIQQLRQLIEEELILAEARSSLSPDQRQGLFQFLGRIQETMVAQQGGSTVAADEAARASSGRSLTQKTRDKLDEILIAEEIRQRVGARVLVTWRQIQLEYERQFDKYNPKPAAVFRMIAVPASKADAIEQVKARLIAGELFEDVADDAVNVLGEGEASTIYPTFTGALSEGKYFDIPALNDAARSLNVGQAAGPIMHDGSAWWLQLARIDRPAARSLYDAQLEIENGLLEKRKEKELSRYFNRLKARGNFSKIEDMVDRLMAVATERYLPPRN